MTDQEIIKALECCANELGCEKCPANEDCDNGMLVKNLFALVTRQRAEIEKLQEIHADATESLRLAAEANKDMQAKIEGLEAENVEQDQAIINALHRMGQIEAEAVREFAEKLKATPLRFRVDHIRLINEPPESKMVLFVDDSDIDNLTKEMEK